ncbi:hypothetical protein N1495_00265 [Streptococcus didelphis]|uniref:Uncharacterized protein n=1 Tax=Streptococcus didelphis TaxID=102886 RepID=A0ABY9LGJ5_9STRE|nr:hypothetical protein [Streptococcus didelphis]WMB27983.1 hypothetical protein N1496_08305 [Streptococcus didelphis]WMB29550.1 hypothetical protein N1495_00265 [Streptococcus didelphis]
MNKKWYFSLLFCFFASFCFLNGHTVSAIVMGPEENNETINMFSEEPSGRYAIINVKANIIDTNQTFEVPFSHFSLHKDTFRKSEIVDTLQNKLDETCNGENEKLIVTNVDGLVLANRDHTKAFSLKDYSRDQEISIGQDFSQDKLTEPDRVYTVTGTISVNQEKYEITDPANYVNVIYSAEIDYQDASGNSEAITNSQGSNRRFVKTFAINDTITSDTLFALANTTLNEAGKQDNSYDPWVLVKRMQTKVTRDAFNTSRTTKDILFLAEENDSKTFNHVISPRQKAKAQYDYSIKEEVERPNTDEIHEKYVAVRQSNYKKWLSSQHDLYNTRATNMTIYYYDGDKLVAVNKFDKNKGLGSIVEAKDGSTYQVISSIVIADKIHANVISKDKYDTMTKNQIEKLESTAIMQN